MTSRTLRSPSSPTARSPEGPTPSRMGELVQVHSGQHLRRVRAARRELRRSSPAARAACVPARMMLPGYRPANMPVSAKAATSAMASRSAATWLRTRVSAGLVAHVDDQEPRGVEPRRGLAGKSRRRRCGRAPPGRRRCPGSRRRTRSSAGKVASASPGVADDGVQLRPLRHGQLLQHEVQQFPLQLHRVLHGAGPGRLDVAGQGQGTGAKVQRRMGCPGGAARSTTWPIRRRYS